MFSVDWWCSCIHHQPVWFPSLTSVTSHQLFITEDLKRQEENINFYMKNMFSKPLILADQKKLNCVGKSEAVQRNIHLRHCLGNPEQSGDYPASV